MSDILENICAEKREALKKAKRQRPFKIIHEEALNAPPVRKFLYALRAAVLQEGAGFICEIKKASPSAGIICPNFSPCTLASDYERAGATCLSVLTDEAFFQGKNEDLFDARQACSLPVLRKDFMLDAWQISESRALGADCVLLIMAAVSDATAFELHQAAIDYGMDVLIEVHNREELERALKLSSPLIGVNSRNLKTMITDLSHAAEIVRLVPQGRFVVSESGIHAQGDVAMMKAAGAKGFLIGESLLKQGDVGAALQKLKIQ
ncbi:MAG: indole-3-glycerol phosphate synthase TrpC [Bdellovibrionales bacterium]